jgi:hypothetical protein
MVSKMYGKLEAKNRLTIGCWVGFLTGIAFLLASVKLKKLWSGVENEEAESCEDSYPAWSCRVSKFWEAPAIVKACGYNE